MCRFIGVSCGKVEDNFCLREYYLRALNGAGLGGVILPAPDLPRGGLAAQAATLAERLDGLLLSGGGDFRPQLWGEYPHGERLNFDQRREDWELALLAAFRRRRRPVLGICRGMQLLNAALGGSLWQDLGERPDTAEHYPAVPPEQTCHAVRCREPLAAWLGLANGAEIAVNSVHHQAVRRLGRGLRPLAVAPDGVVEALGAFDDEFLLGVQWHPERLPNQAGIWRAFAKIIVEK